MSQLKNTRDIVLLIEKDPWMMDILRAVKSLGLPDWWIGAGFVRNKVWDHLNAYKHRTPLGDIDVIYFDRENTNEQKEKELEKKLKEIASNLPWSVKNQARMHLVNSCEAYQSSTDALSKWPETATSIAIKLDERNKIITNFPHGIADLINLRVRPTPNFMSKKEIYENRLRKKDWPSKWPTLDIFHFE